MEASEFNFRHYAEDYLSSCQRFHPSSTTPSLPQIPRFVGYSGRMTQPGASLSPVPTNWPMWLIVTMHLIDYYSFHYPNARTELSQEMPKVLVRGLETIRRQCGLSRRTIGAVIVSSASFRFRCPLRCSTVCKKSTGAGRGGRS